jgi:membrane protease YdiL (CAAX protease family)
LNGLPEAAVAYTVGIASRRTHSTALALYFAVTFALAWVLWFAAAALTSRGNVGAGRTLLFLPGTFAPAIVALWMTSRSRPSGQRGQLLARLFQWHVPARWYVFAASYMVVAKLSAAAVFRFAEGAWPAFGSTPLYLLILATAFSAPVQAGEEIGWRGYALPRLGEAIGFPAASLVLGVIWAIWHLPLFLIANTDSTGQPIAVFILAVTAISVAMTWLYLNTNGSLVPVMLMHAAINNTTGIVPSSGPTAPGVFSLHASSMAWITIGVLWVGAAYFLSRMSRRPRAHAPHGIAAH